MLLLAQGCQNSEGTRSIGSQDDAEFKSGESGISIHYGGGNGERYVVDYISVYVRMYVYICYFKPSFYCALQSATAKFAS